MSLSLPKRLAQTLMPDRLGIALFPDHLVLTRISGGLRRRLLHKETLAFAPAAAGAAAWPPALDALAGKLAEGALANARITVVLSNQFVRYVLVPASDALGNPAEEQAYAQHCFERLYGGDAGAWTLKLSAAGAQRARLACAIEQPLVDALAGCLSGLKGRYRSLQPHLMASFNRVQAQLGALPAWLVVAEPGLICLAHLRESQWLSFSAHKVGPDWLAELPALIAREECLVDCDTACERVLVVAPEAPDATLPTADKRRFESLRTRPLTGLADLEPSYCIALGA